MYFVYILRSNKTGAFYKGHYSNIENRLAQHNAGETQSTKAGIPWQIVYVEEFNTHEEAIKREKYFKTAAGRRFIKFTLHLHPH